MTGAPDKQSTDSFVPVALETPTPVAGSVSEEIPVSVSVHPVDRDASPVPEPVTPRIAAGTGCQETLKVAEGGDHVASASAGVMPAIPSTGATGCDARVATLETEQVGTMLVKAPAPASEPSEIAVQSRDQNPVAGCLGYDVAGTLQVSPSIIDGQDFVSSEVAKQESCVHQLIEPEPRTDIRATAKSDLEPRKLEGRDPAIGVAQQRSPLEPASFTVVDPTTSDQPRTHICAQACTHDIPGDEDAPDTDVLALHALGTGS